MTEAEAADSKMEISFEKISILREKLRKKILLFNLFTDEDEKYPNRDLDIYFMY